MVELFTLFVCYGNIISISTRSDIALIIYMTRI